MSEPQQVVTFTMGINEACHLTQLVMHGVEPFYGVMGENAFHTRENAAELIAFLRECIAESGGPGAV